MRGTTPSGMQIGKSPTVFCAGQNDKGRNEFAGDRHAHHRSKRSHPSRGGCRHTSLSLSRRSLAAATATRCRTRQRDEPSSRHGSGHGRQTMGRRHQHALRRVFGRPRRPGPAQGRRSPATRRSAPAAVPRKRRYRNQERRGIRRKEGPKTAAPKPRNGVIDDAVAPTSGGAPGHRPHALWRPVRPAASPSSMTPAGARRTAATPPATARGWPRRAAVHAGTVGGASPLALTGKIRWMAQNPP